MKKLIISLALFATPIFANETIQPEVGYCEHVEVFLWQINEQIIPLEVTSRINGDITLRDKDNNIWLAELNGEEGCLVSKEARK